MLCWVAREGSAGIARGAGGGAGGTTAPKVAAGCRRPGPRAAARPMQPGALAPIDTQKTRALSTIYAPRKQKPKKNKTAQTRMLDELPCKPASILSPFHPLPAIGQKIDGKPSTKVIVFDLNKNERPVTMESVKFDVLKPLTPLRIHGYTPKNIEPDDIKPQQLLRENTYDVIEPIYLNAGKVKKKDQQLSRKNAGDVDKKDVKVSPKTRFKKAAMEVAKLSSLPETGKLLCLRERQIFECARSEGKDCVKLEDLPQSPAQKLTRISDLFQSLDMKGRHRDKMKKENSWF